MLNSIQLSNRINNLLTEGKSNIVFIIGSSYGVSDDIKKYLIYYYLFHY